MPSELISIESDPTLDAVETHLNAIAQSDALTLFLPTKTRNRLTLSTALIQLIVTWSQRARKPTLRTHVRAEAPSLIVDLERLCSSVVGLTAVTLAKEVLARDGRTICTKAAWDAARKTVIQMENGTAKFQRGTSYSVMCYDNTSRSIQSTFYHPGGTVKSQAHFSEVFRKFLAQGGLCIDRASLAANEAMESVGLFMYELFRNTDDHARTAVTGQPIRLSARGMSITQLRGNPDEIKRTHCTYGPLSQYLDQRAVTHDDGIMRIVEVAIVDSGPGLARRYLQIPEYADLSHSKERQATIDCFNKYRTTKAAPLTGRGLNGTLLSLTTIKAFMIMRTGRIRLYRNFIEEPFETNDTADLRDWPHAGRDTLEPAAGTTYSILFPVPT